MTFRAPVRDLAFALKTVGHPQLLERAYPDLDDDTVQAVLEAAAAFADGAGLVVYNLAASLMGHLRNLRSARD